MEGKKVYLAVMEDNLIDLDSVKKIKDRVKKKIKNRNDECIDVLSLEFLEKILCVDCLQAVLCEIDKE